MPKDVVIGKPRIAPCKDCTGRHVGCHSTCKKYIEFEATTKEERHRRFIEYNYKDYFTKRETNNGGERDYVRI